MEGSANNVLPFFVRRRGVFACSCRGRHRRRPPTRDSLTLEHLIRHPTGATFSHWRRLLNSMPATINFYNVTSLYAATHKGKTPRKPMPSPVGEGGPRQRWMRSRQTAALPAPCHPERRRSRSRTFAGRVKRASKSVRPQDARDLAQNFAIFFVIKVTSCGKPAKLLTRSLRRSAPRFWIGSSPHSGSLPLQNFGFAQDDR